MLKGQQTIEFGALSGGPGAELAMPFILESRGDEHRFSAVILFDAERLSFVGVGIGIDGAGSNLTATGGGANPARVELGIELPLGRTFLSGGRQLAVVRFSVRVDALEGESFVTFRKGQELSAVLDEQ